MSPFDFRCTLRNLITLRAHCLSHYDVVFDLSVPLFPLSAPCTNKQSHELKQTKEKRELRMKTEKMLSKRSNTRIAVDITEASLRKTLPQWFWNADLRQGEVTQLL